MSLNAPLNRKLRMGLIGGGGAGFIGKVHATAALLDRRAELIAGALSSDPEKSKAAAPQFGISRAYGSADELIRTEAGLPDEQRIDFVSIATPNHTHFPIAEQALSAGFHVFCDKPMTVDEEQAERLVTLARETGRVFVVTHNYSGYPLVRQARAMIAAGELGEIQAVRVRYFQGWLMNEKPDVPKARGAWKSDPQLAGPAGALGDIGTHAFHLARYVTQMRPTELSCSLASYYPHWDLDDYGQVQLRFPNSALGQLTFSQVTHGRLNDLSLEVDGTQGALTWRQEQPNELFVRRPGRPVEIYERSPQSAYLSAEEQAACRIPPGHPEGFFEAFANLYRDAYDQIARVAAGEKGPAENVPYPTVDDGAEGVAFLFRCIESHEKNGSWVGL